MKAVKSAEARTRFKSLCDEVIDGEQVFVLRPGSSENVVMISSTYFNDLLRAQRNEEYLRKLDRSIDQVASGKVVVFADSLSQFEEKTL